MKPWPAGLVLALGLLTGACLFIDDGEWWWGSSYYEPCWDSWDCTSDTDGCFEVVVDYGSYGVADRMCSSFCQSDWDCPFGGACYAFPVRQALTLVDEPDPASICSVGLGDPLVCDSASTPVEVATIRVPPVSAGLAPLDTVASGVRPAYEMPICYARCASDWDCPFGFDCIQVVDLPYVDAVCLPH